MSTFKIWKRRQTTLRYTSGVLGISTFLLWSGQRPFGQERVSYCLHFRYCYPIRRNESAWATTAASSTYFSDNFDRRRGEKCDLWVNLRRLLDLRNSGHSYCPIRIATLSTLSRDRGNWLEFTFVAEPREIVKAERIPSLLKSAS